MTTYIEKVIRTSGGVTTAQNALSTGGTFYVSVSGFVTDAFVEIGTPHGVNGTNQYRMRIQEATGFKDPTAVGAVLWEDTWTPASSAAAVVVLSRTLSVPLYLDAGKDYTLTVACLGGTTHRLRTTSVNSYGDFLASGVGIYTAASSNPTTWSTQNRPALGLTFRPDTSETAGPDLTQQGALANLHAIAGRYGATEHSSIGRSAGTSFIVAGGVAEEVPTGSTGQGALSTVSGLSGSGTSSRTQATRDAQVHALHGEGYAVETFFGQGVLRAQTFASGRGTSARATSSTSVVSVATTGQHIAGRQASVTEVTTVLVFQRYGRKTPSNPGALSAVVAISRSGSASRSSGSRTALLHVGVFDGAQIVYGQGAVTLSPHARGSGGRNVQNQGQMALPSPLDGTGFKSSATYTTGSLALFAILMGQGLSVRLRGVSISLETLERTHALGTVERTHSLGTLERVHSMSVGESITTYPEDP